MTHDERVYHHLYETLEGIAEQSERIASLEELALDVWALVAGYDTVINHDCADFCDHYDECAEVPYCVIEHRMAALGLETE